MLVAMIAVIAIAGAACAKKDEVGKPSGVPPLENTGTAPAPPPAAPAMPPPAPAAAEPAAPPPADPGASISGQITVAPAQRSHVAPTDTIFLVARRISDNPTARGSLVAVKKLSAASFPIPFAISAADMPFGGTFDGDLTLTVRADKDGDPMSHLKGDVFGTVPKVRVGARGVKLVLDQLQKEDESLGQAVPTSPPPSGEEGLPPGHPALPPGHP
jgi:cytochrome c-type biogenesis protein CcmH